MTATPELAFWLRHAERVGAAVEPGPDTALVLLPAAMCEEYGLPEEVTVTGDPEAAAEDGAVLLATGHPAVDRAVSAVLDEGDVARHCITWPDARLPDPAWFLARARDGVPVDHGRIDPGGPAEAVYLPVLRIGALVTHTLDDRFQEREEVCVDGHLGRQLPDDLGRRLERLPRDPSPSPSRTVLTLDLARALARAQERIDARAAARGVELATQARTAREQALAEARTYYDAALASYEERIAAAADDRRRTLEAQAVATRAERERRIDDIVSMYTPRHAWRPYRLHLVLAPAARLCVRVRRGERGWPLTLTWLLTEDGFAPVPCPGCGGLAPLVAGRERLGCRSCMPRSAEATPATERAPVARRPQPPEVELRGTAVRRRPVAPRPMRHEPPCARQRCAPPRSCGRTGGSATRPRG